MELNKKPTNLQEPQQANGRCATRDLLLNYIRLPACKRLLNRLLKAQREEDLKTISVLSQFPGEGKTIFAAVMALGYMALLDKRVLIVDTVSQTRECSFFFQQGLGNLTARPSSNSKRQGCIGLITNGKLDRSLLHCLPDSEFSSAAPVVLEEDNHYAAADFQLMPFIDSIRHLYDVIFVDTCALSQATHETLDPIILAQYTDTSVIVASPLSFERETLTALTQELKRYEISPLGIVADFGVA